MPIITSKKQFYDRAAKGLCGNTPLTWTSAIAAFKDPASVPYFGVRWLTPSHPGFVTALDREGLARFCMSREASNGGYMISESDGIGISDYVRGLQGELTWCTGEWRLRYTMRLGQMRHNLYAYGEYASGYAAINLVRSHLDARSYEELMDLFDHYTEGGDYPVIEFSGTKRPMGRLRRNMMVWEIRNGY